MPDWLDRLMGREAPPPGTESPEVERLDRDLQVRKRREVTLTDEIRRIEGMLRERAGQRR